jgi:hypothetical protein
VSSAAAVLCSLLRRDGALYSGSVHASPGRPSFPALSARCVGSEPAGATAVYTSRAVRGRGVSARQCSRRQNERSAPVNFRYRRRKYTGRRAYPRTIRANYTGRRGADALRRTDFLIDRRWRSNRAGDGKENPGCTRKSPVGQAKKKGKRCPILVLDFCRLGRVENRLVGRKNEPVRWGSASPGRSSRGEQKHGGRHRRRSPCVRGVVDRMRERTAGRWGQVGEGGLGIRGSAPSVGHNALERTDPTRIAQGSGRLPCLLHLGLSLARRQRAVGFCDTVS